MWLAISLVISLFGLYHGQPDCNYLAYGDYFYVAADVCIPWGTDYGTHIEYSQSSRYECSLSSNVPKSINYQDDKCSKGASKSGIMISEDESSCKFDSTTCYHVNLIYTSADKNPVTHQCDRFVYSSTPLVYKYPVIVECLPFIPNNAYHYKISCDNEQFNYNLYTDNECETLVTDEIYSIYKNGIDDIFACFQCTSEYGGNDENNDDDDDNYNTVSSTTVSPVSIFETLSVIEGAGLQVNDSKTLLSKNTSTSIIIAICIILPVVFLLCIMIVFYQKRKHAMNLVNAVVMSNSDNAKHMENEIQEGVNPTGETMPIHVNTTSYMNTLKGDEDIMIR